VDDNRAKLLIVEDDVDGVDMLAEFFKKQAYLATTINSSEDALESCQVDLPDKEKLIDRLSKSKDNLYSGQDYESSIFQDKQFSVVVNEILPSQISA
jgi:CheY-like chemotaxis protein